MKHNLRKVTEGRFSITSGIFVGTAIAGILSLLFALGLTSLVLSGNIAVGGIDIPIFFVRAISVLAGTLAGTGLYKEKLLMNIGITAACYLLLITVLGVIVFDASISNLAGGVLSVVSGGAAACIIRLSAQKKSQYAGKRRM